MLPASGDQVTKPRPSRKWPTVANRHRRQAIEEATRIVELMTSDFLELLKNELGTDIEEALSYVRTNPARAIRKLQDARLRLNTVLRSAELVQMRAGQIVHVLESAPADDEDNHHDH